ncbi:DUF4129 domain-containing transglutaminase family protein [Aquibacillus albus]|uniref:Transglutaminase-like putative cysteine protease n=1 Tax=Aquibacillus albus TaxID=1168171 RepID=A0ABS2N3V5_9BACI|nr:transglutaminaseTgpA domain-containing protein [Aquibacillus albus]MBM7572774.1 transglutaminase-like putative cysteine protease [Aquibacillus albus]
MEGSSRNIYQSIIYLCGFLLFWEWLRPLSTISDTGSLSVFVGYTAFCFLISMLKLKSWLSFLLKLAGLLFVIDVLFISERMFSKGWFYLIYVHGQFNVEMILNQQWNEMTPMFRSFLFLLLLWLMSYLLYYWFVIAKRIFLFILLTFIYITILDTFTMYDGSLAIIRIFVVSLVAMGINGVASLIDRESISQFGLRKITAWFLPLLGVILFSMLVGFASPKLDPQWPDPVPFIQSTAENAGFNRGNVVQKVGYGEDDSQLGGSFIQDHSPVFQAATSQDNYWRIESKDFYSGKGWEQSTPYNYQEQSDGRIMLKTFRDGIDTTERRAMVRMEEDANLPKVVYPYGIRQIQGMGQDTNFLLDEVTGSIQPEQSGFNGYDITYRYPSFSIDKLQTSSEEDPEGIKDLYLQLPDDLPERVKDLAEQIVVEEETRYDKVTAIEQYFSLNGYTYQTENVAVPEEDEDYVDQFLFETMVGYCDNFSTSMVVLLRSLDIPARWVKGFTNGDLLEEQPQVPDGLDVYQISNSNAHSWVEVYFPDVGWVPFEPTVGFASPVDFFEETTADPSDNDSDVENEQEDEVEQEQEEEEDLTGNFQDFEDDSGQMGETFSEESSTKIWSWIITIAVILAVCFTLYFTRYRWVSYFILKHYKQREDKSVSQDAYHYLLKILERKGIKRERGQTLREYAKFVDEKFESTEMSRLTHYYERTIYRNEDNSGQWDKISELWENLVKRSLS